jgi:D-alanyl-D-alanine carboxypeptidase
VGLSAVGSQERLDEALLARLIESFQRRRSVPGLAVAIGSHGRLAFAHQAGFASIEDRMPVRPDTMFAIGSITKQIAAAAILKTCSEGQLSLEASVGDTLGQISLPAALTIRHLLSHTSGISYDVGLDDDREPSLVGVLERCAPTAAPPGSCWLYNNTNYFLLGHALTRLTGKAWAELVTGLVIPPVLRAGITLDTAGPGRRRARGYAKTGRGFGTVDPPDARSFGSGSAYATAAALARWAWLLWSGRIVDPAAVQIMMAPVVLATGERLDYGVGCFTSQHAGVREFSHDGITAGFSSQLAFYPDHELAICVLTNTSQHIAEELEKEIVRTITGRVETAVENPPEQDAWGGASVDRFCGRYGVGDRSCRITVIDKRVILTRSTGRQVTLERIGTDRFREGGEAGYEYEFGAQELVAHVKVRRQGKLIALLPRYSPS